MPAQRSSDKICADVQSVMKPRQTEANATTARPSRVLRAVALLAIVGAVSIGAWYAVLRPHLTDDGRGSAPPAAAKPTTNVVIVLIDTLRADRLGCYGHTRPTSPRIDALAREG